MVVGLISPSVSSQAVTARGQKAPGFFYRASPSQGADTSQSGEGVTANAALHEAALRVRQLALLAVQLGKQDAIYNT
jgi:hypothetical protein